MNFQIFWRNIILDLLREWRKYIPNKKKVYRNTCCHIPRHDIV